MRLAFFSTPFLANCMPIMPTLYKLKSLNEETWVAGIEQSMMLVLVIGRWLMPSAGMTSEQLYQLLLMDSGLGADMLDLIDAFKESGVEISRNVRIIGLSVFSWSLMQFPLALTQANYPQDSNSNEDMWSLFIIIGMQDGPSLVFRMYLLIQEKVRSQMMIFFIGKHFISIVFEVYRIFTVIHKVSSLSDTQAEGNGNGEINLKTTVTGLASKAGFINLKIN
uniref:Uncharacterized protein n=1 Tax=Erpetoichthys calabaricus TaxID=27687 RepID=A0A8C4SS15_ERPCA